MNQSIIYIELLFTILTYGRSTEGDKGSKEEKSKTAVDYSELATQAELHKKNILTFLNKKSIQKQYVYLFEKLLHELNDSSLRIVKGKETPIAAVPWQVLAMHDGYPLCGGGILTDSWVISAAHCFEDEISPGQLQIRVGSSWENVGGKLYNVGNVNLHPQYCSSSFRFDVALLNTDIPLHFTPKIMPIKLISRAGRMAGDRACIVSGWGDIRDGGPSSPHLKVGISKTVVMKRCLEEGDIDVNSMFCASCSIAGACQGDSGGPIVTYGVLIGVVSHGKGCGYPHTEDVHARLNSPQIWDWINAHISPS